MQNLEIRAGGLDDARVVALLEQHLRHMERVSPPESRHALDLSGLLRPRIEFFSGWVGEAVAVTGALKRIDAAHGEIKSMRTADGFQRRGAASAMLRHLLQRARQHGFARVSLETGAMDYFEPARRMYAGFGFVRCGPFEGYREDPNSVFMTMELPE